MHVSTWQSARPRDQEVINEICTHFLRFSHLSHWHSSANFRSQRQRCLPFEICQPLQPLRCLNERTTLHYSVLKIDLLLRDSICIVCVVACCRRSLQKQTTQQRTRISLIVKKEEKPGIKFSFTQTHVIQCQPLSKYCVLNPSLQFKSPPTDFSASALRNRSQQPSELIAIDNPLVTLRSCECICKCMR